MDVARGDVRRRMATDALAWWWMPWRGDLARGVGIILLVSLWQSCLGVGVVPRHVAGEVVRCRIATVARSASPAPCGSCPQVGECGSGAAGVGCALERWVSF